MTLCLSVVDIYLPVSLDCCCCCSPNNPYTHPQAKSAVSAGERDRKELEGQLAAASKGIEAATAALNDLQRQIRAAEVRGGEGGGQWGREKQCGWQGSTICGVVVCQQCASRVFACSAFNPLPLCPQPTHSHSHNHPHHHQHNHQHNHQPQAELATDMNAGLSAAERRQLGELGPQIEELDRQLKQGRKATLQVGDMGV